MQRLAAVFRIKDRINLLEGVCAWQACNALWHETRSNSLEMLEHNLQYALKLD
jgi:hypothetical protein